MGRRAKLALLAVVMFLPMTRFTGCADACEEAIDYCLDCDVENGTCHDRFADAPDDKCERAVEEYRQNGCDPNAQHACGNESQPDPQ